MGRPRLRIGTYGAITSVYLDPSTAKARARFRDYDGTVRTVARFGPTKGAAEDALREALLERQRVGGSDVITTDTTLSVLADAWLAAEHDWSDGTRETYEYHLPHIKKRLGDVRVGELRLAVINRAVKAIRDTAGPGAAKTVKTCLSGMCQHAIAYEALDRNPMADALPVTRKAAKERPRALTVDEATELLGKLRADPLALEVYDLPDLVEWMLGTGARIGEACAARDGVLDLHGTQGTWEINATVKRIRARGLLIQERTKTDAGWRVVALPPNLVAMAGRRLTDPRYRTAPQVLFTSPKAAAFRDPSNTPGQLRATLDRLGYQWVTSHVFRKTVATRLEEAGLTARMVADQLGHAKPSMTQDVYFGRDVVSAEAAAILAR